jgi:hypothetical protein
MTIRTKMTWWLAVILFVAVAGPATSGAPDAPESNRAAPVAVTPYRQSVDLTGRWRMLLPAGFEHEVRLVPAGGGAYRLEPGGFNSSGIYSLREGRLVLVEPTEQRLAGFEWTIRSPYLMTLTAQPGNTGSDYSGAILFRSSDRLPAGSARPLERD